MTRLTRRFAAVTLFAGLALAACDSPIAAGAHDEAAGFRIIVDGETYYHHLGMGEPLALTLPAASTIHVEIQFLEDDGDVLELGAGYSAAIETADPTVVAWSRDTGHMFRGQLVTGEAGSTTLRVAQMHGSHHDYRSPHIPVMLLD
jgi:hypothetical protein